MAGPIHGRGPKQEALLHAVRPAHAALREERLIRVGRLDEVVGQRVDVDVAGARVRDRVVGREADAELAPVRVLGDAGEVDHGVFGKAGGGVVGDFEGAGLPGGVGRVGGGDLLIGGWKDGGAGAGYEGGWGGGRDREGEG